jgi:DNA-binding CsgD family transcriptional regulator
MEQFNSSVYPGMVSADTEIFNNGGNLMAIHNGSTICFDLLPISVFERINQVLQSDIDASTILKKWFPKDHKAQVKKFASCRFGGLDHTPDIGVSDSQQGEYWDCPMHGSCTGEGVVCKMPVYKDYRLTAADIRLIKLLTTGRINTVIADELNMPLGSFHAKKKKMYKLLGVMTRPELTRVAVTLNIIKPHITC